MMSNLLYVFALCIVAIAAQPHPMEMCFQGSTNIFNSTGMFMMETTMLEHRMISQNTITMQIYTITGGKCMKAMGMGTLGTENNGMMMYSVTVTGTGFMMKESGVVYMHGDGDMMPDVGLVGSGTSMMNGQTYTHSTVAGEHWAGRPMGVSTSSMINSAGMLSMIQLTNMEMIEPWIFSDLVKALNCQ